MKPVTITTVTDRIKQLDRTERYNGLSLHEEWERAALRELLAHMLKAA